MKAQTESSLLSGFQSHTRERILDVDGTLTTQPVLEHVGICTWPGRLTLTDHALYFEALKVVTYDKAKVYDLADDLIQIIRPELTGPWGSRLFDKAVMYKSTSLPEPVIMEFPELTVERVVSESRNNYKMVEKAQATVDGVKLDGLDTNVAVMKELLYPMTVLEKKLIILASWDDPLKSFLFCFISSFNIFRYALIINIGDLFQAWSNGVYKSVEHRVMSNPKVERFSTAYFLCPSYDTMIQSHKQPSIYKEFTFKEYRQQVQEDMKSTGHKVGLPRFLA